MKDSKIEWTTHTLNLWWGCVKITPGCRDCYAKTLAERWGFDLWGVDAPRRMMSESYWRQPVKWDKAAAKAGERHRVFTSSMSDWAEIHRIPTINAQMKAARMRLAELVLVTPHLDWLLLTKRIENAGEMLREMFGETLPKNVGIGASVENQEQADTRIPHLLAIDASVRFLSMEPLLGPVDLRYIPFADDACEFDNGLINALTGARGCGATYWIPVPNTRKIHWVIVGGESGPTARVMHPDWVRSLRDQCQTARVPFFFKQWGEWIVSSMLRPPMKDPGVYQLITAGGHDHYAVAMVKVGKKAAGRELDGVTYSEVPTTELDAPIEIDEDSGSPFIDIVDGFGDAQQ